MEIIGVVLWSPCSKIQQGSPIGALRPGRGTPGLSRFPLGSHIVSWNYEGNVCVCVQEERLGLGEEGTVVWTVGASVLSQ